MPAMPRPSKKATKIAFDILGVPANMQRANKHMSKYSQILLASSTSHMK